MHRKGNQRRKILRGATAMLAGLATGNVGARAAEPGRSRGVSLNDEVLLVLREAPRSELSEKFAELVRAGMTRGDALAGLTSFAIERIQPWPDVGFKYHAVMVLQSLAEVSRQQDSNLAWPALFWGVDYARSQSEREYSGSGWRMEPISVRSLSRGAALKALVHAIDRWDREAAEYAVTQLLQRESPASVLQVLMPLSARDYRSIGHKVITAANAHRMMITNGGFAAELLARSLVIAVTNSEGDSSPAENDHVADRSWAKTLELSRAVATSAPGSSLDWGAGAEILSEMRTVDDLGAVDLVSAAINARVSTRVIWEALLASAGEQMLREGSFVAIHSNTMADALRYIYYASHAETDRLTILHQAAALIASIRSRSGRARRSLTIDGYEDGGPGVELAQVFESMEDNRLKAVSLALSYLEHGGDPAAFIARIRAFTVYRASGSHDFKYAEAVIENYNFMQGPWKNRYLATAMLSVNGPHNRANRVVQDFVQRQKSA